MKESRRQVPIERFDKSIFLQAASARRQPPESTSQGTANTRGFLSNPARPTRLGDKHVKRFRQPARWLGTVSNTSVLSGGTMTQPVASRPIALVVEADREERALVSTLLEESEMQVIECDSAEAALAVVERKGDQ